MALFRAGTRSRGRLVLGVGCAIGMASLGILGAEVALAQYVGASYVKIPGIVRATKPNDYAKWLRFESFYWKSEDRGRGLFGGRFRRGAEIRFPAPSGPREGKGEIAAAIDKRSSLLRQVMKDCAKQTVFPEVTFAVNSLNNVPMGFPGWGRPAGVPEYYEYRLTNVRISDCPVVADAPEQAVVLSFSNIEWLNYKGDPTGVPRPMEPAKLRPMLSSGTSKTFVASWIGVGNFVDEKQCEAYNKPPSEDQYYELLPKDVAEKERKERAATGGVSYRDGTMELRGPNRLNAVKLPGIVRDPGQIEPRISKAIGLDLDNDDGTGRPPAGICRHGNFESPDGRRGIDNQLYRVQGCNTGYQGQRGYLMQYGNEQRRNGTRQMLIHVSGIDNEQNDDEVDIALLYSDSPMAKSANGTHILPDYTFRLTSAPAQTAYNTVLRGKIVDGAIVATADDILRLADGSTGAVTLHQAKLRFQIAADGSLRGVVGGYVDWRRALMTSPGSSQEYNHGLQIPAWYNSMKRHADGMKNPETGQCDGISTAYEIEGSAAFLSPAQNQALMTGFHPGAGRVSDASR